MSTPELTCIEDCQGVNWEHVLDELKYGAFGVAAITSVGILANVLAPKATANLRGIVQSLEKGLSSFSPGCALALGVCHLAQCGIWSIRAWTGDVDVIYWAVELLLSIYVFLDMLAAWVFVVTRGMKAVGVAVANGSLMLDCLVLSSVAALTLTDSNGDQTWFSFSYLAAVRLVFVLEFARKGDAYSSNSSWWRQGCYHILIMLLFVFASAATIMILEHLATPAASDEPPWDLPAAALFAFHTMFVLGGNIFVPRSVLGRAFTMGLICWSLFNLLTRILPLLMEALLGKGLNNGAYGRGQRHIVLLGTPTGPMLWEFMQEVYHPNHFHGISDFDQKAPDVVVMLPNEQTLKHLRRYLGRQESIMFRERVTLLAGDAFKAEDLQRVALDKARVAIVLPDLTCADAEGDDHANIMRMFAVTGFAPEVRKLCLLHRAYNIPANRGNGSFLSIDMFKLSILAIACIAPGALAFVSNLCKTIGDTDSLCQPWQRDYESGLGAELYEVILSPCYHEATFREVFEDVLARSSSADVYLVGIVERPRESTRVRMHPGAGTRIRCSDGRTAGVFVAPDLSAVQQCRVGEDMLELYLEDDEEGSPGCSKLLSSTGSTLPLRRGGSSPLRRAGSSPLRRGASSPLRSTGTVDVLQLPPGDAKESERQDWESELQELGYQKSVTNMQHQLLLQGFGMKVVSAVTSKLQEGARLKDWKPAEHVAPQHAPRSPSVRRRTTTIAPVTSQEEEEEEEAQPALMRQEQRLELERRLRELRKLHGLYETSSHRADCLPAPPATLLENGGHVLLCVVDAATLKPAHESVGPDLGIGHFLRPLRDKRMQAPSLRPSVVVLAPAIPGDWYTAADEERVFFIKGSPLCLEDLDAAGFRKARSIAIVRQRGAKQGKVVDSCVVLAASLIEQHLPHASNTPVITEHTYSGSCSFLPTLPAAAEVVQAADVVNVGRSPDVGAMLGQILASSKKAMTLDSGEVEEDYEGLQFTDYLHHPRFMKGQVFVASVITGLTAGTVYNPSCVSLVSELLRAPMLLLQVPQAWERRSYAEFSAWLLKKKDLLAVGIYRGSAAANAGAFGQINFSAPTLFYTFTAPAGNGTLMIRSDRVLCILPSEGGSILPGEGA